MFEEEEDEVSGQSRLFVILSIALIGLLVLGLLGIGGVFVIRQNIEEQALASRPTPTLVIRLPESTPAAQSPSVVATNTPAPTATNTPVVQPGSGGEAAASSQTGATENVEQENGDEAGTQAEAPAKRAATATPEVPPEIATASEVPDTGLGAVESVALALGLITLFVFARRMRMRTT